MRIYRRFYRPYFWQNEKDNSIRPFLRRFILMLCLKSMNDKLNGFLKDLFVIIQEMYERSLAEESEGGTEADVAFLQGESMAYYSVLSLINNQLVTFGYEEEASEFEVPILGKSPDQT